MFFLRQLKVGPQSVFAYLIGDTRAGVAAAIDPAAQAERLKEMAEAAGLKISLIINTHGHADHTCGNAALKALTCAELILGRGDLKFLQGGWAEMSRSAGFGPSPQPDRLVGDGDEIRLGSVRLKVLETPGHSPGSICLYTPGHLFCGDTMLINHSGRTDIPGASLSHLADSLERKILPLPLETVIWPGHRMGRENSSTLAQELARPIYAELLGR